MQALVEGVLLRVEPGDSNCLGLVSDSGVDIHRNILFPVPVRLDLSACCTLAQMVATNPKQESPLTEVRLLNLVEHDQFLDLGGRLSTLVGCMLVTEAWMVEVMLFDYCNYLVPMVLVHRDHPAPLENFAVEACLLVDPGNLAHRDSYLEGPPASSLLGLYPVLGHSYYNLLDTLLHL